MTDRKEEICSECNIKFESCSEQDFCHCKDFVFQFGCPVENTSDDDDMPDLE